MKIGIDAHNLEEERTGVARYLLNLLNVWKDRKDDNQYILYFQNKIPQNEILDSPKFTKKIIKNIFRIKSNALWEHYSLPHTLKKDQVDIFFSPSYISPIFYKGKIIIVLHDICYEAHPEWFNFSNRILLKEISKISARKAKLIVTVSEHSKNEIIKYYKADKKKIFVAYLGADPKFMPIQNKEKIQEIKEKYKIKDKFIFFVGSMFNRRCIPELLEAFQKIKEKYPDYQLLLIGRNHTYPYINIENTISNINNYFQDEAVLQYNFIEDDNDLNLLYNAAEMTIYLSLYEGFGLPLIESMACGTPVITNQATSLAEVADRAAIFVNPKSSNSIANGIEKIISSSSLQKELQEKGIAQAKKFNWQQTAEETIKLFMSS